MDVNEQIAKVYFEELYGYVVKTNHYFKKRGKKGAGPADIDLILVHPKNGKYGKKAICSVKGWQSYKITLKSIKNRQLFEKEWKISDWQELAAAERFFGSKYFNKILILPPIERKNKKKAIEYCKRKYGIVLLDFSDVLFELIEYLSQENRMYRSFEAESLQTLRMILVNLLQIKENELILQPNILENLQITRENHTTKFKRNRLHINGKK